MSKASPSTVLRFIANEESLERTLTHFPEWSRGELFELLEGLADRLEAGGATSPRAGAAPRPSVGRAAAAGSDARVGGDRGFLRIYSDGAARGNPGPAGAGAVLVDGDGKVVERLGRFLGTRTNNYAEYAGLLLGLQRASELGAREIEVFADSELLVRQLQGRYQVRSPSLRPLWVQARELLQGFERVRLQHIPRERNELADEMSNRAIDERL